MSLSLDRETGRPGLPPFDVFLVHATDPRMMRLCLLVGVTGRFVQNCTLTALAGRRGRLRRRRGGLGTKYAVDSPPGATRDTQYPISDCTDFIGILAQRAILDKSSSDPFNIMLTKDLILQPWQGMQPLAYGAPRRNWDRRRNDVQTKPAKGPFLEVLQAIRRLLTRREWFRLKREFAGLDFHQGEQRALARHTPERTKPANLTGTEITKRFRWHKPE